MRNIILNAQEVDAVLNGEIKVIIRPNKGEVVPDDHSVRRENELWHVRAANGESRGYLRSYYGVEGTILGIRESVYMNGDKLFAYAHEYRDRRKPRGMKLLTPFAAPMWSIRYFLRIKKIVVKRMVEISAAEIRDSIYGSDFINEWNERYGRRNLSYNPKMIATLIWFELLSGHPERFMGNLIIVGRRKKHTATISLRAIRDVTHYAVPNSDRTLCGYPVENTYKTKKDTVTCGRCLGRANTLARRGLLKKKYELEDSRYYEWE